MRSSSVPDASKQELSSAVQDLLKQLFTTVTPEQSAQQPGWDRCGCYLLLRALTRSQQFLQDPGLPILPSAAVEALRWLKQHVLGAHAGKDAAAHLPARLPVQDDKPFLLLTRLVLTATGAPAAVAAAAAELDGVGYYAAISSAVSAAAVKGVHGSSVHWSDTTDMPGPSGSTGHIGAGVNGLAHSRDADAAAAGAAAASACVRDPVLLCELLDWSSTNVKLALQRLLEPSGAQPCLVLLCASVINPACSQHDRAA
jgi:hypothetical protein